MKSVFVCSYEKKLIEKALEMFSGLYESLIGYARENRESLARS